MGAAVSIRAGSRGVLAGALATALLVLLLTAGLALMLAGLVVAAAVAVLAAAARGVARLLGGPRRPTPPGPVRRHGDAIDVEHEIVE